MATLQTATTWRFHSYVAPREVFATMEQMLGIPPYRFQLRDEHTAEIVETQRLGVFGNWTTKIANPAWVRVVAMQDEQGTRVEVSVAARPFSVLRGRRISGAGERALQLVKLLSEGGHDYRTVYRDRRIPAGPVTLVASWAGTRYPIFVAPSFEAARGAEILTATRLAATGENNGPFVKVVLPDASEGWIERDQCVPAPAISTRAAQARTAVRSDTY